MPFTFLKGWNEQTGICSRESGAHKSWIVNIWSFMERLADLCSKVLTWGKPSGDVWERSVLASQLFSKSTIIPKWKIFKRKIWGIREVLFLKNIYLFIWLHQVLIAAGRLLSCREVLLKQDVKRQSRDSEPARTLPWSCMCLLLVSLFITSVIIL